MVGRRKMLGLAVAKRSATAVEVGAGRRGAAVRRAAEFVFPEGTGLEDPPRLGKALKAFLEAEGFSASRCVIGLDAARLTGREKTLPPGTEGSAAQILSVAIEREFASDRKDLLFDYTAGSTANGRTSILLLAAPRGHVDRLTAMAQGAGLAVDGVTSTTMALAESADGLMLTDRLVLHVFSGGVELAVRTPDGLILVWRLSAPSPPGPGDDGAPAAGAWLDALADDLRRSILMRMGSDRLAGTRELLVWDECGLEAEAWDGLADRLGVPVRPCTSGEARRPADGEPAEGGGQYSAAAAMALSGLKGHRLPVDFLHSRLAPKKGLAVGRKVAWGIGVAAAVVLAGGLLVLDLVQTQGEVADLEARLARSAETVAEAESLVSRAGFARGWYDRRPPFLDCLRAVTYAFPAEGGIYATNLRLDEAMEGVVSGKAERESMVLGVLDRLKAAPHFAEVKPLYLREAGRGQREIAFAVSFRYVPGAEQP
ncbi:MAG: hypothetical protein R6X20_11430 [Phycisphaerae bacterium]